MSVKLLLALATLSQAVTFFTCRRVALKKVQNSFLLLKTPMKVKKKKKITQLKNSDLHTRRVDTQNSVGTVLLELN